MTDRNHPSAAFWATVALVAVLVGYPLSIGPACWIASKCDSGADFVRVVYRPLTRSMLKDGDVHRRSAAAIIWYSEVGSAKGWHWRLGAIMDDDGNIDSDLIWARHDDVSHFRRHLTRCVEIKV